MAECTLLEPDTGNLEGIMETLFWLDADMLDVLRCSLTMPLDKRPTEIGSATVPVIQTNAKTTPFNAQPTMLWSENDLLNCLFNAYAVMQYRYHIGKITHEKYFKWKLQWSFGSTITHSSPQPKDIEALLQNSNAAQFLSRHNYISSHIFIAKQHRAIQNATVLALELHSATIL